MASSGLKDNITAISLWNSCCCFCSSKWCTSSKWTASCKNATAMKNASKMIFLGATLALLLAGFPASALPNSRTSEPWRQSRTLTSLRTSPRLLQLPFVLFLFPFSTVPIFPHPNGPPFHRAWAPVQSHKTAIHFSKAKPDGVQRTLETKQTNTFLGSGSRRPPEHLWQHFLRHLR